ncbi:MAG: PQQ-dependent sugar dehydrogenase [Gammaproteobacteria bacterium]|nr:PQQ-dependent sugar dehydrogenase [Gammaproteobacteria bacterium]
MLRLNVILLLLATLVFINACSSSSDDTYSGLSTRPANPACEIPDPPDGSTAVTLERVFTSLSFNAPVLLKQSPINSDRWYVVEQGGIIRTFLSGDLSATVFADLSGQVLNAGEQGLLGMAFHPEFASNRYLYVYYSADPPRRSVISRFTANDDLTIDGASELLIMEVDQPYANHNGGNIEFGADGYLYIGLGDGGSGGDPLDHAQNINTLLGSMLRIDVDNSANPGVQEYSNPADNPYVGTSGLDEIYAIGLRNPWRWSFDRVTGNLVLGDVGQGALEEVDVVVNGGNYGWRCYEGTAAYNTSGCSDSYIAPIHEYGRSEGRSITGGFVYRGSLIPSLVGSYIFSDYYPGPIWALSNPYSTPVASELINNSTTASSYISSFAEDADGELYAVSRVDGYIYQLVADTTDPVTSFPTLLSQTGCVDASDPTQMAQGLIPYQINAPFWSDGADKSRYFAIPDASTISIEANGEWTFPNNSVTVKNFRLNDKLVETRLLVKHRDGSWGGYSYEWNDLQTDASLVLDGKTKVIDGQAYIYPSTSDCMSCHTAIAGSVLGLENRQMNRDHLYLSTGRTANQMVTLNHIGMFSSQVTDQDSLPVLTDPADPDASIDNRARAYLYTNCSQCHRFGGPTNVTLDFNITTADADMNICEATPSYNIAAASYILAPGDASESTLYHRLNCREGVGGCMSGDEMPPLGSTVVDSAGVSLIETYINSLMTCPN